MKLRSRLARLEKSVPISGCPACRHRVGGRMINIVRECADGTRLPRGPTLTPEPCSRCGQVPEQVIELVEVIVTTREQALKVMERMRSAGQFDNHDIV